MEIILIGAEGKMGQEVIKYCSENKLNIVAKVDERYKIKNANLSNGLSKHDKNSVFFDKNNANLQIFTDKTLYSFSGKADVIIDFSTARNRKRLIEYALNNNLAYCCFSTTITKHDMIRFENLAKSVPVLISCNTSVGNKAMLSAINILHKEFKGSDMSIIEYHNRNKKDVPSGTARQMINLLESNGCKVSNISSIRAGNMCGLHQIEFFRDDERIVVTHEVFNKSVFASGAVKMAQKILKLGPCLRYDI